MKKQKIILSTIIVALVAIIGLNNVFAAYEVEEYLDCEIVGRRGWKWNNVKDEVYEGENFSLLWSLRSKYIPNLEEYDDDEEVICTPYDIFDYEVFFWFFGSPAEGKQSILLVDDDATLNGRQVYKIQVCSQEDKEALGASYIAQTKHYISDTYLDDMEEDTYIDNGVKKAGCYLQVSAKLNTENGDLEWEYGKLLEIIEFKNGDVNRDHLVDFFDIIQLIRLVYDMPDNYVWDTRVVKAANMDSKNTQTPDFFSIINLINYVYDGSDHGPLG